MLTIGEVAEKTGVSVRSLRHYDEIGLLQPSGHSEAGYRLYSKENILRLQQIVSLKQMKLPLKKIMVLLDEDAMTLKQTLLMQKRYLEEQLASQQSICSQVDQLLKRLESHQSVSLDLVYKTMEAIKMFEKFYTKEQREQLAKREIYMDEEAGKEYSNAWDSVFSELAKLQSKGVDPADKRTKAIAVKADKLIKVFTGGDKGIEQSLNTMYQTVGGAQMLRNHGLDVSDALYEYYEAVLYAHVR